MDLNITDINMFDLSGNLNLQHIFVNSWFFGFLDIGFLVVFICQCFIIK